MCKNKNYKVVLMAIVSSVIISVFMLSCVGSVYETKSLDDYGKIVGNYDNDEPRDFIFSFFPKEVSDNFSDINYHYKAIKGDTYAYECYLEFVIEDTHVYEEFIGQYIDRKTIIPFAYDDNFYEKSICNYLWLFSPDAQPTVYWIENAKIGKILFSDEQQRIIFMALGMDDGGGANTEELGLFFDRFQIDPWEYMKTAYHSEYYEEQGVTNEELPYYEAMISIGD